MQTYLKTLNDATRSQTYQTVARGADYEWKQVYQRYYEYDPRVVRVLDVNNTSIVMEHLDGWSLNNSEQLLALEAHTRKCILQSVFDIYNTMIAWKDDVLDHASVWIHNDYYPQNLYYCRGEVRLIDPEAFDVRQLDCIHDNNTRMGKFFETYSSLIRLTCA